MTTRIRVITEAMLCHAVECVKGRIRYAKGDYWNKGDYCPLSIEF